MGTCWSKKRDDDPTAAASVLCKKAAPEKTATGDVVKKEIFVIKHRRSHSHDNLQDQIQTETRVGFRTPVRASSCTREEVDAILIQCGRLSRSSSANTPAGKKHSGSKQSFDLDNENEELEKTEAQLQQSRSRSSPSKPGRKRTPSRERSESRERSVGGTGRRVSRSPGRRSETPAATAGAGSSSNGGGCPGKMVSVPASLTSSLSAGSEHQCSVRRVVVRRDVRSPRSQSPAQTRHQPPPLTLSRSNSRNQSPYRRTPFSEIDNNHSSQQTSRKSSQNQSMEDAGTRSLSTKRAAGVPKVETNLVLPKRTGQVSDSLQPKLSRGRSWSRSQDFDELGCGPNPNPNPSSYASVLLEDIQNFHQKSSNVVCALPQSATNSCANLETVADMNSTTSSSFASNENSKRGDRRKKCESLSKEDMMEASLHKYVTLRRGTLDSGGDEESSGSNSVAGGCQQQRLGDSPSKPNSVEPTGCMASKTGTRSRNKELLSPLGFQRQGFL